MTLSSTWMTRSAGLKSLGVCFMRRFVVKVIKLTAPFRVRSVFWVKKL